MADAHAARSLRAALRMLAPACMRPARRFLLRHDPGLALAVVSDDAAVGAAALITGDSVFAGGGCAGLGADTLLVPFLNLERVFNVGFVVMGTVGFNCPDGREFGTVHATAVGVAEERDSEGVRAVRLLDNVAGPPEDVRFDCEHGFTDRGEAMSAQGYNASSDAETLSTLSDHTAVAAAAEPPPSAAASPGAILTARSHSHGRYIRDERSGEILYVLTDVRPWVQTLSLVWVGPPLGADGRLRETISLTCDAALFSAGALVRSVLRCEHVVRVTAAPFTPLTLPASPTDISVNARNMEVYAGDTDGYLVPRRPRARREIDLSDGRRIFTSTVFMLRHESPRGAELRGTLLGIAVQARLGEVSPPRWAVTLVVDAYLHALQAAARGVERRQLVGGDFEENAAYHAADGALAELFGGEAADLSPGTMLPIGSAGWGRVRDEDMRHRLVLAASTNGNRYEFADVSAVPELQESGLPDVVLATTDVDAASPRVRRGLDEGIALLPPPPAPDVPSLPFDAGGEGSDGQGGVRASAGAVSMRPEKTGAEMDAAKTEATKKAQTGAAKKGAAETEAAKNAAAENAAAEKTAAEKAAVRRARNIAAAKRSNAKRKQAFAELVATLELARSLRERLAAREGELRRENAALRAQASASGQGTPPIGRAMRPLE